MFARIVSSLSRLQKLIVLYLVQFIFREPSMLPLILASTSPRRKELMEQIGLPFSVISSPYEEDMTLDMPPEELAAYLSLGKAEAVLEDHPNSIIIAADTIVVLGDAVLGKPHTDDVALKMLRDLSGTPHRVITGLTVANTSTNQIITKPVSTEVIFRDLTNEEIEHYVASGEPLDKAGAYGVQGLGATMIKEIRGDYYSVVGLPISTLIEALREVS